MHLPPPLILLDQADDLLVIYKPHDIAIHPGAQLPDQAQPLDVVSRLRAVGLDHSPAHRLDRATSGLALMARGDALRDLGQRFAAGTVHKHYLALVHGRPRRKGIIRRPLPDARRRRPLPAVTRYRVIRWLGDVSLVHVRPETGRKHQIRRHFEGIGHPLVGDTRYPGRRRGEALSFDDRLWLHAWRLELEDGREWAAPLGPEEAAVIRALAISAGAWSEDGDEIPDWAAQITLSS